MGMPRYAARTDDNHLEVKHAFRDLYYSVVDTSRVGDGFPDLIVGKHGADWKIETKMPGGKLRPNQKEFFDNWRGSPPLVMRSRDDVIAFDKRQRYK